MIKLTQDEAFEVAAKAISNKYCLNFTKVKLYLQSLNINCGKAFKIVTEMDFEDVLTKY